MYIRRKVFSLLQDENGEEKYFSTTEFEDERLYAVKDIDAEEAPLTARTDIRQSNRTQRNKDYYNAAVEDNKDRRANGLSAKMVDNAKDYRKAINANAADRREKRNEYAADRRAHGYMAKSLENAKDIREKRNEYASDRRKSGLTAKMLENAKDYRKTVLEDNKDRRARRNERQDRRLKAKYGR